MNDERYEAFEVPVEGGALRCGRWGRGAEVVLAIHGITGNHRHFDALADRLGDDVTLIAADLRGRGASGNLGGPYGMGAHAQDQVAVLDHLGVGQALVVGHSMGGFVAVVLAHHHPARVSRLELVDGGLPLGGATVQLDGRSVQEVARAVLGPSLDRLAMTFASVEAYLDFWRVHPALAGQWNPFLERALAYDLIGEAPQLRSSVREEAVLADMGEQLTSDVILDAVKALSHPTRLTWAPRGLLNQVPPLYPAEQLAHWEATLPNLRTVGVSDVNHYTILLSPRGAAAVAEHVREG